MPTDRIVQRPTCKGCNLPFPTDWCWENKLLDCWADYPPRNIDTRDLLGLVRDLTNRVRMLEEYDDD